MKWVEGTRINVLPRPSHVYASTLAALASEDPNVGVMNAQDARPLTNVNPPHAPW
jgi:hypothetical protein